MSSLLSLLWWVGIGLAFFWMMSRGGCGMGHAHGHGHAAGSTPAKPIDAVDKSSAHPHRQAGG